MKRTILLFFFCSLSLLGQDSLQTPSKWNISVTMGIQQHDKRLYNYPQRQSLFDKHPGFLGTYQIGIRADKTVIKKSFFDVSIGVGISAELSTFTRPFDQHYKGSGPFFEILLATNRYYKNLLQLPLTVQAPVNQKIKLGVELLPQFNFLTTAGLTNTEEFFPVRWWGFNFHSLEINPSLCGLEKNMT